jgi:hypothetical protein
MRVRVGAKGYSYFRNFPQVPETHDPSIAAYDIEAAEVCHRLVHQFGRLGDISDVGLQSDGVGAEGFNLSDDFEGWGFRVRVIDDNFGAAACELDGHCGADAAARARNQRDFAVEAVGDMRSGAGRHGGVLRGNAIEGLRCETRRRKVKVTIQKQWAHISLSIYVVIISKPEPKSRSTDPRGLPSQSELISGVAAASGFLPFLRDSCHRSGPFAPQAGRRGSGVKLYTWYLYRKKKMIYQC